VNTVTFRKLESVACLAILGLGLFSADWHEIVNDHESIHPMARFCESCANRSGAHLGSEELSCSPETCSVCFLQKLLVCPLANDAQDAHSGTSSPDFRIRDVRMDCGSGTPTINRGPPAC
jgi:hypothetical protein